MSFIFFIQFVFITAAGLQKEPVQERDEIKIVNELFRLRNEHKADSAEQFFADTVLVYMKYLKNVSRKTITQSDKNFWEAHPNNKFEMTAPVQIKSKAGIISAVVIGKEYLDGTAFKYERIELKFDRNKKIISFRGFKLNKGN
jgi:hypothetical protein